MKEVAISQFKAKCLGMLEEIRKTRKPIRVTRFRKPVADVIPPSPAKDTGRNLGLALLCRKKRFRVQPDVFTWAAHSIAELQISEAPVSFEVALSLSSITFSHGDPAAQFIAATAAAFDMTLVTSDEQLLKIREIPILANR